MLEDYYYIQMWDTRFFAADTRFQISSILLVIKCAENFEFQALYSQFLKFISQSTVILTYSLRPYKVLIPV
jgi:hypothetical protein